MSPNDARSLFGRFEKKAITLDKSISKVVIDTNCILYIHYSKVMNSYHGWDSEKAKKAFHNHTDHVCRAITFTIDACQELLDTCVEYFSERNIYVTFAFDGMQPIEKIPVLKRRARKVAAARKIVRQTLAITNPTQADIKKYYANITASVPPSELFYELFVTFIEKRSWNICHMPNEIDYHCADRCARGIYDAMVSNDWDPLLFGCPVIIREVPMRDKLVTYVRLDDVLSGLMLTREELCAVCILSGVDYNYECEGYAKPMENYNAIICGKESGFSLNDTRRCINIDENILRWDICKQMYRLPHDI